MEIKGIITNALPEQSGTSKSGKSWRKKEYIVEYEHGQYPKSVVFSVIGQKIDELNIQQGAEYDLSIDFEAREWNGRHFCKRLVGKRHRHSNRSISRHSHKLRLHLRLMICRSNLPSVEAKEGAGIDLAPSASHKNAVTRREPFPYKPTPCFCL